ncbi:MAG: hypothetical protein JL50_01070 [Peptococcaceae bacterium BICA1-7]|nr:MAG: hypothetical protein JL50_01070 [Peptococcaceae bacterium BICA1-7]HBV98019.1 hypothetical protein [Desulfotomaculum sp.]
MSVVNKAFGGVFFISAGVLLAVTKTPDIFTVAAVIACSVIAAISLTSYAGWSVIGGALLIAGSLVLQTALSYRCMDCIKADLLILAGVIYLSIIETSERKNVLRGMAAVITTLFMVNALIHYPVFIGKPMSAAASKVSQHISVSYDGTRTSLDISAKPVLLFSTSCGACRSTIGRLAETDPGGKGWVPVQVDGDPGEGRELLDSAGYLGSMYQSETEWDEAVPALIITRDGQTSALYGQEKILEVLRGDSS